MAVTYSARVGIELPGQLKNIVIEETLVRPRTDKVGYKIPINVQYIALVNSEGGSHWL